MIFFQVPVNFMPQDGRDNPKNDSKDKIEPVQDRAAQPFSESVLTYLRETPPVKPTSQSDLPPGLAKATDLLPKELLSNPIGELNRGIAKLDNIESIKVSRNPDGSRHVSIDLEHGLSAPAPNVMVGRQRPLRTRIDEKVSFDVKNDGVNLSLYNINGLSTDVQGPLGRVRNSRTQSMTIRPGENGYVDSTGSARVLGREITKSVRMGKDVFAPDDFMHKVLDGDFKDLTGALRLYQDRGENLGLSIDRKGKDRLDITTDGGKPGQKRQLQLNTELKHLGVTVSGLELDNIVSASLKSGNSVGLENISGIKAQVEKSIFGLKTAMSITPERMTVENVNGEPALRFDLKIGKEPASFTVPVRKLREEAAKKVAS